MPDTVKYNDLLNRAFDDEDVLTADIGELKRYLLACAEMRDTDITNPRVRDGLPKRTEFIRELISIRLQEEEIRHNRRHIYCAIFFAAGAFALSVWQEVREHRRPNQPSEPAAATASGSQ